MSNTASFPEAPETAEEWAEHLKGSEKQNASSVIMTPRHTMMINPQNFNKTAWVLQYSTY